MMKMMSGNPLLGLQVKYFSVGFLVYGGAALLMKFFLLESVQSLAFLPVALGMFGGPAAAFGVAAGFALGEWCAESVLYFMVTGTISIFFQAYLPYKLWYTVWPGEKSAAFICSGRSILKYAYITLLNAAVAGALFGMIAESGRMVPIGDFLPLFMARTVDSSWLLGLPLLILLSGSGARPYVPRSAKASATAASYDAALYIIVAAGIGGALFSRYYGLRLDAYAAFGGWVVMFLLLSFFMQKPVRETAATSSASAGAGGAIYLRVVLLFLAVFAVFIAFTAAAAYRSAPRHTVLESLDIWQVFLPDIFVAGHLLFLLGVLFMWRLGRFFARSHFPGGAPDTGRRALGTEETPPDAAPAAANRTAAQETEKRLQEARALDIVQRRAAAQKRETAPEK